MYLPTGPPLPNLCRERGEGGASGLGNLVAADKLWRAYTNCAA